MRAWGIPLLGVLATAGCVHRGFTRTSDLYTPSRSPYCYLDIVLDGKPDYAYVVIGRVTTDATAPGLFAIGESEDVVLQRLKEEACKAGAHVLFHIETSSQGQWTQNGFSRSNRGTAVAAVYVDDVGVPLPAPEGPVRSVKRPVRP